VLLIAPMCGFLPTLLHLQLPNLRRSNTEIVFLSLMQTNWVATVDLRMCVCLFRCYLSYLVGRSDVSCRVLTCLIAGASPDPAEV
jgi:hypothetical protein